MEKDSMLKIKNINKTFITTKALDNVKLDINRGEIRGLAGENGSGKSTLASIIAGILFPDCGQMLKDGKKYSPKNMIEANNSKVGIIVQELGTIEDLSVGMNIFLGKEDSFTKFGFLNKKKLNNSASILLKKYGLENIKPEFYINELRLEERKLVELVKALYFDPDLLIIDETSSTLSQFGRGILYKVIQKLKKDGKSVIFITHDLAEIITYTDNITIMKDGKIIDTINSMKVDEGDIKKLITKPKMTAFGLNWQHCFHTIYFPTFSYEQYYQAIRRFWRFGQKNNVIVDLVYSDGQKRVLDSLIAKAKKADELFHRLNGSIHSIYNVNIAEFDKKINLPNFIKP